MVERLLCLGLFAGLLLVASGKGVTPLWDPAFLGEGWRA